MTMTALRVTEGQGWPVMAANWKASASSRPKLPGGLVSVACRAWAAAWAARSSGGSVGSISMRRWALGARVPQGRVDAALVVFVAGHGEEQVREAVEISQRKRAHLFVARQGDDAALGAAADGAGHVQVRGPHRAAGQHEVLQRPNRGIELVDECLERLNVAGLDLRQRVLALVLFQKAQVRAQVKQLVLEGRHKLGQARGQPVGQGYPQAGVELIHGAHGHDARRVLGHTLAAAKAGFAFVATAGVEAG